MVASARLFEIVLDLPYSTALIFGTFATLAYVFLGGFLAVSWTDTIQGGHDVPGAYHRTGRRYDRPRRILGNRRAS
mgnify:CR=1 FL=1